MHVCLITSSRPIEIIYGGEERFTRSLRKWLLSQKHDVTIVGRKIFGVEVVRGSDDISHIESGARALHPRVLRLPYPMFILTMLFTSLLFSLKVMAINRRSRISVIHAQDTAYGGLSAIISAKILKVPVIVSSHSLRYAKISNVLKGASAAFSLPWEYWLDAFTSKYANLVIAVSSAVAEFFSGMGQNREIRMIPIGIEITKYEADQKIRLNSRKDLGVSDDVLIGFVGRFAPEKNLLTLLKAYVKSSGHAKNMRLIFVGAGSMEAKLRMLSCNQGISKGRVIFTGIRRDVSHLLSAFDVFTLPSYTEGCPTALIEAMAASKAIIASNIPSIKEIVRDGKEAILFAPDDVEALSKALLLLYRDTDLRARLGQKARERVELYDIDRIYHQILDSYKELCVCTSSNTARQCDARFT